MDRRLAELRNEYGKGRLARADLPAEPLALFASWLDAAADAGLIDPHAMALATATAAGAPSCRLVLLKSVDERGFVFATNYESRKGRELDANPRAAATFWWPALERQVRVEGTVTRTTAAESDAIFAGRSPASRVASAASAQSRVIADRAALESRVAALAQRHADGAVPRPESWGGYRLRHETVEFWQGGRDRVHDRFLFARAGEAGWRIDRLQP